MEKLGTETSASTSAAHRRNSTAASSKRDRLPASEKDAYRAGEGSTGETAQGVPSAGSEAFARVNRNSVISLSRKGVAEDAEPWADQSLEEGEIRENLEHDSKSRKPWDVHSTHRSDSKRSSYQLGHADAIERQSRQSNGSNNSDSNRQYARESLRRSGLLSPPISAPVLPQEYRSQLAPSVTSSRSVRSVHSGTRATAEDPLPSSSHGSQRTPYKADRRSAVTSTLTPDQRIDTPNGSRTRQGPFGTAHRTPQHRRYESDQVQGGSSWQVHSSGPHTPSVRSSAQSRSPVVPSPPSERLAAGRSTPADSQIVDHTSHRSIIRPRTGSQMEDGNASSQDRRPRSSAGTSASRRSVDLLPRGDLTRVDQPSHGRYYSSRSLLDMRDRASPATLSRASSRAGIDHTGSSASLRQVNGESGRNDGKPAKAGSTNPTNIPFQSSSMYLKQPTLLMQPGREGLAHRWISTICVT